jgi:hypothetical protein
MIKKIALLICFIKFSLVYGQTPNWTVNEGAFQQTQTLICKLSVNGKMLFGPNDMVGAFVGNECRGVAKPVYIPSLQKYLTYLTIFSNTQGDSVTFKLFDSNAGTTFNAINKLVFKINEHIGTAYQSYVISTRALNTETRLTSFGFFNTKIDSSKIETDLTSGRINNIYYIPFDIPKSTLIPQFVLSQGANLYYNQSIINSNVTKVDLSNALSFEILSEDEKNISVFNLEIKYSKDYTICNDNSILPKPIINETNGTFCDGDSLRLSISNKVQGDSYWWIYGNKIDSSNSSSKFFSTSDTVRLLRKSTLNCYNYSAPFYLIKSPRPSTPIITRDASNQLVSNIKYGNKWYKEGVLTSDTTQFIKPLNAANYSVRIMKDGCPSMMSSNYYYLLTDIVNLEYNQFVKVTPNPFVNNLNFDFLLNTYRKVNIDILNVYTGMIVFQQKGIVSGTQLQTSQLTSGVYILSVSTEDNRIKNKFKLIKL